MMVRGWDVGLMGIDVFQKIRDEVESQQAGSVENRLISRGTVWIITRGTCGAAALAVGPNCDLSDEQINLLASVSWAEAYYFYHWSQIIPIPHYACASLE
jgi:hypothetical protein